MPARARTASLVRASVGEMIAAARLDRAPLALRAPAALALAVPSVPLCRALARFDAAIPGEGLVAPAHALLASLGVSVRRTGAPPARGPLLVLANHPGAYDALVAIASLGREDLAIVAADRRFLRALPHLAGRLLFAPDPSSSREVPLARGGAGLRAMRHLRAGGALLHFAAGRIEPDPAFARPGEALLAPWAPGTGALVRAAVRAGATVAVLALSGVHAPAAKRSRTVRAAEARGVTTLAPLLQLLVPAWRRVDARAELAVLGDAGALVTGGDAAAITSRVRERLAARLADAPR